MSRPVIFLDIDGVLLSSAAWSVLPANRELQRQATLDGYAQHEVSVEASFDPVAIGLANRLAERAGAELVVSSYWRYGVGPEATRAKLVSEGIHEHWFSVDWCCPQSSPADKRSDIRTWLRQHPGTEYVVLDDEVVQGVRQVLCDPVVGLGVREYREAAELLGIVDRAMSAKRR